jgi:hypothetical protein
MNRAERMLKADAERAARGPYTSLSMCSNSPCGRCARPLKIMWSNNISRITDHGNPFEPAREILINFCPKCYDDLIAWLDIDPNQS